MAVHQAIMSRFRRLPVVVTVDVKLHQIIISIVYVILVILDHFVSTVSSINKNLITKKNATEFRSG